MRENKANLLQARSIKPILCLNENNKKNCYKDETNKWNNLRNIIFYCILLFILCLYFYSYLFLPKSCNDKSEVISQTLRMARVSFSNGRRSAKVTPYVSRLWN